MHAELHRFLAQLAGVVALTLAPVVLVAFMALPLSLNHHPGEAPPAGHPPAGHMT